eukprot:936697-Pelagomonas_calceolata.AAC.2
MVLIKGRGSTKRQPHIKAVALGIVELLFFETWEARQKPENACLGPDRPGEGVLARNESVDCDILKILWSRMWLLPHNPAFPGRALMNNPGMIIPG